MLEANGLRYWLADFLGLHNRQAKTSSLVLCGSEPIGKSSARGVGMRP